MVLRVLRRCSESQSRFRRRLFRGEKLGCLCIRARFGGINGEIMPEFIADAAVALSLMREALELLDALEHAGAAVHLRRAINELTKLRPEYPSLGIEDPEKP